MTKFIQYLLLQNLKKPFCRARNKSLTNKNSISGKKPRCIITCRFFVADGPSIYSLSDFQKKQVHTRHVVAQNHLQNIAKIGPFGDDF